MGSSLYLQHMERFTFIFGKTSIDPKGSEGTKNGITELKKGQTSPHEKKNWELDDNAVRESIWLVVLLLLAEPLHAGTGASPLSASLFAAQPLLLKLCQCKTNRL